MSNLKYDLFTDEISLKVLHVNSDMTIVRTLLKDLKKAISLESTITSPSDLEEFKNFEKLNIENSINAVQFDNQEFRKLKLQVNPYMIFTESNILENGSVENAKQDIILQPNFIPFNSFHYVPTYLYKKDKNLKALKLKYKIFSPEQIEGFEDNEDIIIDLLKSFLLKQYLTIVPEND